LREWPGFVVHSCRMLHSISRAVFVFFMSDDDGHGQSVSFAAAWQRSFLPAEGTGEACNLHGVDWTRSSTEDGQLKAAFLRGLSH